jgi:predicted ATPase/DNA-binding winged helix-turn-helix (wHTH) protein
MDSVSESPASFEFGRFTILPQRRKVFADGRLMELGGRAFDVLVVLIEARGAIVSKDELMSRVWPGRIVEENNLHAQVKALRKAFSDHDLIRTVVGRGYQFTGQIRARPADQSERADPMPERNVPGPPRAATNLPAPISDLIGRDAEIGEVIGHVADHRFVTLTGTGGIGKTRLALEIARHLLPQFADGVWIAELASLSDPQLVPVTVGAALGLELVSGVVSPERLAVALGSRHIMLVLDNCEHVVDAAAGMVEALLHTNPAARVIATSCEPLRAQGERLYRVPPLAVPADDTQTLEDVLQQGAVALFVARVQATDPHFSPDRRTAAAIAAICRRLDGIPLAIELAAARASTLGVQELASRLDDRFSLLTEGLRTALRRHQTLRATFDWSYELLSQSERAVLRQLSIFAGDFNLVAASAIIVNAEILASNVVDGVANLVAKSLVGADLWGATVHYRLLETTRAHARRNSPSTASSNKPHASMPNTTETSAGKPRPNGRRGPRPSGWRIMAASSAMSARRWIGPFRRAATHRSAWSSRPLRYPYGVSCRCSTNAAGASTKRSPTSPPDRTEIRAAKCNSRRHSACRCFTRRVLRVRPARPGYALSRSRTVLKTPNINCGPFGGCGLIE